MFTKILIKVRGKQGGPRRTCNNRNRSEIEREVERERYEDAMLLL